MSVFNFFSGIDLCSAWNPVCIGMVYGVIGKVKVHPGKKYHYVAISIKNLTLNTV
jgi:hypothetical protein